MTKKQIQLKWKKLKEMLEHNGYEAEEIVSALKDMRSVYEPNMLSWLGGLFDCEIGGFYYSNSARDNEEFFPDIESTGQAIGILENAGVITSYRDIPGSVRSRIACFICSCEDSESGFFYNPQWSKDTTDAKLARRGRDLRWAVDLAEMCNFEIPNPTVFSRIKDGSSQGVPEFLRSEKAFREYLNSLNWKDSLRKNMHILVSQCDQIIEAGLGEIALEHISGLQNPETGLFGDGYLREEDKIKLLKAVVSFYAVMEKPVPMAEKLVDYAMGCIKDDADVITYISACWYVATKTTHSLRKFGTEQDAAEAARLVEKHKEKLPSAIRATGKCISRFKKPDGSFSYLKNSSSSTSQTMPVAIANTNEGDVNGTLMAIAIANSIVKFLTGSQITVPVFDSDAFLGFLEKVK